MILHDFEETIGNTLYKYSARLALLAPEEKRLATSEDPSVVEFLHQAHINSRNVGQLEWNANYPKHAVSGNHQPIIEEPPSPEPEPENAETKECVIEDFFCEDPDEIPTFNLNIEEFTQNLKNYMEANLKMLTCQWHWLPLPLKLLPFQLQSSRILVA